MLQIKNKATHHFPCLRRCADHTSNQFVLRFNTCSTLETITVDRTWALPSGISWASIPGSQTFSSCNKLVGGAGTVWSSSKVTGAMSVIYTATVRGYLTAGWA